ncbi:kinase-like domain-containing protein [Glomus cerebriforme]|uniref:Kinase-like domain-containing protein n=1 Tax=Glomus cerebriforme TaxID=658196 RepID=A0A397TEH6_9GLOM|nr:kinase-like domain-containing protein [Glomus cerebriforme]
MTTNQENLIFAAINRANALIDYNIYNNMQKSHEFRMQTVLADKSLTDDDKIKAVRILNENYDRNKVLFDSETKRVCENCNQECLATLYCECCIQNYLKTNLSNWSSGNSSIDNLIRECQAKALHPEMIIEWIPYINLQNVKYLTKGGFSKIYTADWVDGRYDEWDSKELQLKRIGFIEVILKELQNVENANQSWYEEAKSHLTISNKWAHIVKCFGLTQNPSNGIYMLVMHKADIDLRKYLRQTQNQLTWREKVKIIDDIASALSVIHSENAIHRDLHSGNILYTQINQNWYISDLGFCGPADKPSTSIYGNLPYIAPEVLKGNEYTSKSDVYSIAMLMWEISSGQPPFNNYEHDYYLAMNIIKGMRPKIVPETPLKYKSLMKQCWDADPSKRPNTGIIMYLVKDLLNKLAQPDNLENGADGLKINYTSDELFKSKIYQFENLPEPRNATEEEQEAFHSKSHNSNISDDSKDFIKLYDDFNSLSNASTSEASGILKNMSERLSKVFKKLQINSNDGK